MIDMRDDRSERVKYDYPDFPVYIRRGRLSEFPNYTADSHWHDDIELIAVLSGGMQYNVNGKIVTMGPGEGIFVNTKHFHYGFSDTKTECEYICILFHPFMLCATGKVENDYVVPLLNSETEFLHLSSGVGWQKRMLDCIGTIWDRREEDAAPLLCQGLFCLLWSEAVSHIPLANEKKKDDYKLTALKNMIAYIHENYMEKITLADIAAAGYISKRTCGTLFMEYRNKTPIEFLVDYRLRKSIELMKTTDRTILEIGMAVGFSGASYYAETFRKHFGESPAEYRKKLQKEKES